MRILSDFDGVWTDQTQEARWILESLARHVAAHMGVGRDQALAEAEAFLTAARREPARNGWWPRGFLTAFVDEDPALGTGTIAHWLDAGGELGEAHGDAPERWRRGVRSAGFDSVEAFSSEHFVPAMTRFRAEHGHHLVPDSVDALRALEGRGIELVIVSNSPRSKLVGMFADAGLTEHAHLRFVGDAHKWWIDDPAHTRSVGGRTVHVDRPRYRAILEREAPDLVIGDVPSFDLAAAAVLREASQEGEAAGPLLVLKAHPHSPAWALDQPRLARDARFVDRVVHSVLELESLALNGTGMTR